MNAYELAKELKEGTCIQVGSLKLKELADVLIQMADHIKHLEQGLESSIALNKAQVERQNVACNFMENSCTFPCKKQGLRETKG
ncbi:MAG: hypothetical protein EBU08_00685 [Micrococcales bacterium]|nr:hypothetical protein [Micrococcales bacterium]